MVCRRWKRFVFMKKFFGKIIAPDYPIADRPLTQKIEFWFFIFLSCSVVGFIYEEIYFFFLDGKFEWRGFLYGPWLPVYGFGGLFIFLLFNRMRKHPVLVFFLSMFLTGVLEFFTGFLLFEVFSMHWWDYTTHPFNIMGYTCLDAVLSFAVGGMILIYVLAPRLLKAIDRLSLKTRHAVFFILLGMFAADFVLANIFPNTLGTVQV